MHSPEVVARFWAKVAVAGLDDCWLWSGARVPTGYGRLSVGGQARGAHIVAWEIHHGMAVPPGHEVRHVVCGNPPCVNPAHLAAGTRADNMDDMVRDGHSQRGRKHYAVKLTVTDVLSIRISTESNIALAERYGVAPSTISNIKRGYNWAWLT